MTTDLPIIIIGAGVSGLALAQGLAKNHLAFQVYEADQSLDARAQGYRVRISDEGIEALKQQLSEEHFANVALCCNTDAGISNAPQMHLDAITGEPGRSPFQPGQKTPLAQLQQPPLSADRGMLRQTLLEGIEDRVFFGRRFLSYTDAEDLVSVTFEDGHIVKGSILVGADGVWSRVRRQLLPSMAILDTEARLLFGKTSLTPALTREFSESALKGMTFIRDDTQLACLLEPMRFPDNSKIADYIYWVLFLRADADNTPEGIADLSPEQCAVLSNRLTKAWHPSLRTLFSNANSGSVSAMRILTTSPGSLRVLRSELLNQRVTVIGDAAHAMSPTAALGATTALRDSFTLLSSLQKFGLVPAALRGYETSMMEYASVALIGSQIGGKAVFKMKPFEDLPEVHTREVAG